jgi:hypothetical protein
MFNLPDGSDGRRFTPSFERVISGQQLISDDAQGKKVRTPVILLALHLLW